MSGRQTTATVVKSYLLDHDITQSRFCDETGLTRQTLNSILMRQSTPKLETLVTLAHGMDMSLAELLIQLGYDPHGKSQNGQKKAA